MKKNLLLALISILTIGCQRGLVYSEFESIPSYGWEADSVLLYMPQITDSLCDYELQIILRHTNQYAYQNLWFFVDIKKDSLLIRRDTIESYLADDHGNWLGAGMQIYELPLMYMDDFKFNQAGIYEMSIQQGMREDTLRAITDVGMKIIKK